MDDKAKKKVAPQDASAFTQVLNSGAAPIEAVLEKTSPGFQEKLSQKLEAAFKAAIEQMMATFDEEELESKLAQARAVDSEGQAGFSDEQLEATKASMVELRRDVRQKTIVGSALTGSMGFLGQLADLPAFYLYAIRTIGDIAVSYGFDPRMEREQLFLLETLRIGHVAGRKNRLIQLDELSQQELDQDKNLVEEASYALSGRGMALAARQIAKLLIRRKLGSMIPIIGAVVNAGVNWHLMGAILDTADRAYRSKAILHRNKVAADS